MYSIYTYCIILQLHSSSFCLGGTKKHLWDTVKAVKVAMSPSLRPRQAPNCRWPHLEVSCLVQPTDGGPPGGWKTSKRVSASTIAGKKTCKTCVFWSKKLFTPGHARKMHNRFVTCCSQKQLFLDKTAKIKITLASLPAAAACLA